MQVFGVGPASPLGRLSIGRFKPAKATAPTTNPKETLRSLLRDLRSLGRQISNLERVLGRDPSGSQNALVVGLDIGLHTTAAAAHLESTDEMNALVTTFSTANPQFSGQSSSSPTIGGAYNGGVAATFTFVVTTGGQIGSQQTLEFDVVDGQNQLVEHVTIAPSTPAGTPVALSNGLTLALGSGIVKLGDSFQLGVHPPTAMAVNATNPFNGIGSQAPNFEPGYSVSQGQFQVNGQTIFVQSDDSIQSVIDSINAAGAGVTATLDANERISLTQNTVGATGQITLAGDTSGFLAATKLAGAALDPGTDDETSLVMAGVSALSGISAGTFTINGAAISVDPAIDSLQDVVDRINQAQVGATASIDSDGRVSIYGSGGLAVSDNGTGFLDTLGIADGVHEGRPRDSWLRRRLASTEVQNELRGFEAAFNDLFTKPTPGLTAGTSARVRGLLTRAVNHAAGNVFGDNDRGLRSLRSDFGLDFSTGSTDDGILDLDRAALRNGITEGAGKLHDFFVRDRGGADGSGLLGTLGDAITEAEDLVLDALDRRGTVLDLFA